MGFFLGIDLGTSYFKAGLFDEKGNLKGMGRQVVKKNYKKRHHLRIAGSSFLGNPARMCLGSLAIGMYYQPGCADDFVFFASQQFYPSRQS